MRSTEFVIAGPGFPSTAWSVIQGAQRMNAAARLRAMERLMSIYWRPVYWTLRTEWNSPHEEAKDLTQEYLTRFFEQGLVDSVARDKGRFRAYVKATLKHFMLNHCRALKARKRGGGRRILPLEEMDPKDGESLRLEDSPERRFERELMCSILQQALEDLERQCVKEDKRSHFELFQAYYLAESRGEALSYKDLQARFSLGGHQVKNRLAELRTRYRRIVLTYLRDGIRSEADLLEEIREVFDA